MGQLSRSHKHVPTLLYRAIHRYNFYGTETLKGFRITVTVTVYHFISGFRFWVGKCFCRVLSKSSRCLCPSILKSDETTPQTRPLTRCIKPAAVSHVLMKMEHRFTSLMELLGRRRRTTKFLKARNEGRAEIQLMKVTPAWHHTLNFTAWKLLICLETSDLIWNQ